MRILRDSSNRCRELGRRTLPAKGPSPRLPFDPGYYWLAYTWSNLYLSCQFCNQRRVDPPTLEDRTIAPARGKHDQFPLSDEATRVHEPDGPLDQEARLLIDPCLDSPEDHLVAGVDGMLAARHGSLMGETTITVFHLNRKPLRDERARRIREVLEIVEALRRRCPDRASTDLLAEVVLPIVARDDAQYLLVTRSMAADPAAFGLV